MCQPPPPPPPPTQAEADRLNRELLLQQRKLTIERTLAHGLIANVFPRDVTTSLIGLFEKYASDPECMGSEETIRNELSPSSTMSGLAGMPQADLPASVCSSDSESGSACRSLAPFSPAEGLHDHVGRRLAPRKHPAAAILFADIVGFTTMASTTDPSTLVQYLDSFFGQVDEVCEEHHVEKIKTIGVWCGAGWGGGAVGAWGVVLVVGRGRGFGCGFAWPLGRRG